MNPIHTARLVEVPAQPSARPQRRGGSPHDKILDLDDLGRVAWQALAVGQKVVLCHGTFDLMHIGHVRHLEAAREHGDLLIVTVTGDAFVNKGPGRPVFSEHLRAEMLAQLEVVDFVAINQAYDAVNVLEAVRPTFYVKGQDYRNPDGDITGKIVAERDAVEAHGGRLVFTEEIVFSSSQLINQHMNVYEPHVRKHLDTMREAEQIREINRLFDQVAQTRMVLVGEAIIDEYHYVHPMAKAPKENILATRYQDREVFAGGVIATANHAASFCREVDVITVVGERDSHLDVIEAALKPNVRLHAVVRPGAPTVRKCRFVDPTLLRKLFEIYHIDDSPLPHELADELNALIRDLAPKAHVVVANDFGHGMIGPSTVATLTEASTCLAVNTQTNSANLGFNLIEKYPRADLVVIDSLEARFATGEKNLEMTEVINTHLPRLIDCRKFVVTQGRHGCTTYERGGLVHSVPAFSPSVVDTMGAGDAVLAVAAPLAAVGASADLIGFVGNVVGGQKVNIVGHRQSVDRIAVQKAITALLK
jgi:rfaE bifunctional protein nucleotidyltransferase chain/domain